MSGTKSSTTTHYGIGTVARLTGLTDHTIRVWERRYGAVDPVRSDAGRRRYTAAHVERLGLLKRLVDLGESIGTIDAAGRWILVEIMAKEWGLTDAVREALQNFSAVRESDALWLRGYVTDCGYTVDEDREEALKLWRQGVEKGDEGGWCRSASHG